MTLVPDLSYFLWFKREFQALQQFNVVIFLCTVTSGLKELRSNAAFNSPGKLLLVCN